MRFSISANKIKCLVNTGYDATIGRGGYKMVASINYSAIKYLKDIKEFHSFYTVSDGVTLTAEQKSEVEAHISSIVAANKRDSLLSQLRILPLFLEDAAAALALENAPPLDTVALYAALDGVLKALKKAGHKRVKTPVLAKKTHPDQATLPLDV